MIQSKGSFSDDKPSEKESETRKTASETIISEEVKFLLKELPEKKQEIFRAIFAKFILTAPRKRNCRPRLL